MATKYDHTSAVTVKPLRAQFGSFYDHKKVGNSKDIYELAACHFIRKGTDVLFIGPPGVGKTHLSKAIGYEAIKQGFIVRYRSIFDLVGDFLSEEALQQRDKPCASTSNQTCSLSMTRASNGRMQTT